MKTAATTQPQIPTADEARAVLFREVHVPVFMHKLAQHGIQPANEQEATALLEMGAKLQALQVQEKQAAEAAHTSKIAKAAAKLDAQFVPPQQSHDPTLGAIAKQAAAMPELAKFALAWAKAQTQQAA